MARDQSSLPAVRNRQQGLSSFEPEYYAPARFFGESPWQMMRRMQEDMNRMFGSFFPTAFAEGNAGREGLQAWSPSVDVSEDDKEWRIEVDLPGVNKNNIDVKLDNGQLRIRAEMREDTSEPQQQAMQEQQGQQRQYHRRERRYGYFERVFTLPDNVDDAAIRCDYRDGVLICHLPKSAHAAQQARRLPIGDGSQSQTSAQQKKAA